MFYQIIFIISLSTSVFGNFYEILGVSRSATDFDIKNSYKKLARIWHPDKNKNPKANDHFTKINEAYEALSNPEKRKEYDAFGSISNEPRNNWQPSTFGGGYSNAYFDFGEHDQTESNYKSTNYRHYKIDILPNSFKQPTLILLVSHFCLSCHHAIRLWNSIAKQITESGINVVLADVMADANLREELKVQHVPTVVMIIDGQIRYIQSEINKETVIDFIRYSFPSNLVQYIQSEDSLNYFHDSWTKDSRSKMIMAKPLDRPSFRFLSIAFKYRDKISAGFIHLEEKDDQTERIIDTYGLRMNEETIIIFQDEKQTLPDKTLLPKSIDKKSQVRLSLSDIEIFAEKNYLLPLPRLLSQSVFDQACPPPSQKQRSPGFCAIVVVHSKHEYNLLASDSWHNVRTAISGSRYHGKMLYLFRDIQYQFLESLKLSDSKRIESFDDQVILLWRQSYTRASTYLLPEPWQHSNIDLLLSNWEFLSDYDSATEMLKSETQRLLVYGESDTLSELVDELADPLWMRMGLAMIGYPGQIYSYCYDYVTEPFNLIMLAIGLIIVSYVFSTFKTVFGNISREDKSKQQQSHNQSSQQHKSHNGLSSCGSVTKLTGDSYSAMIKDEQHGQLVCVLLTCQDTGDQVLRLMRDSVARLRRLACVTIDVDLHPHWLQSLIANVSNCDDHNSVQASVESLSVIGRQSAHEGIVLALNFGRCYLSLCPINLVVTNCAGPADLNSASTMPGARRRREETNEHSGRFFDWLCQLTDGTCRRYHVSQWPLL